MKGTSQTSARAFAALDADEQRADQPGANGRGDGVDVVITDTRLDQRERRRA